MNETSLIEEDASQGAPLLSLKGVRKSFPGVLALDSVDLEVRAGEVHALLGANGAGKSTLIKIVSGLYKADAGELLIDDVPIEHHGTHGSKELGISAIYQEFALVPDMSVAENLFLGREICTPFGLIDWKQTYIEARHILDRVGIDVLPTDLVRNLSTGQRQLVEIAKALSIDAKLLILDEPTAALSQGEAENLFALIHQLAKSGVGMIYVSHRLEEIAPLVDRVTILRDGKSVGTFPVDALDRQKVVSLITGHKQSAKNKEHAQQRKAGSVLLETRNLTRKGEFENISITARRGEITILTGLVGAGRTEVLETIFGARKPEKGEILLDGKPVNIAHPQDAIEAGIALIPEDRRGQGISVTMPIFSNITLASLHRFVRGFVLNVQRELVHASKMIDSLAIKAPHPKVQAGTLSGGNQQKVVLAKWLSTSAELYLFDEPTQGVDVGAKKEIYRLMNDLAMDGKAILVSSSDLEEVMEIADRIIPFRKGKVVGDLINKNLKPSEVMDFIVHGSSS